MNKGNFKKRFAAVSMLASLVGLSNGVYSSESPSLSDGESIVASLAANPSYTPADKRLLSRYIYKIEKLKLNPKELLSLFRIEAVKITLANIAYNMKRLVFWEKRRALAG